MNNTNTTHNSNIFIFFLERIEVISGQKAKSFSLSLIDLKSLASKRPEIKSIISRLGLESEDLFEQAQREQEQEEYSDFQEEEDDLI